MPLYTKKIKTPPLEEKKTELLLEEDMINKVNVKFPAGCYGLLHIRIFYGDEQIIPKNKEESITGDDEVIEWLENWKFPEKPCSIVIYTYNEDDTYDHQCFLRIVIAKEEIKKPKIRFRRLKR